MYVLDPRVLKIQCENCSSLFAYCENEKKGKDVKKSMALIKAFVFCWKFFVVFLTEPTFC